MNLQEDKKSGISGSTVKLVALVFMLIDHIGVTIVGAGLLGDGLSESRRSLYYLLRGMGRIAFPLFVFLLIEGFRYTRDNKKYLVRLLLFAFISETPFDIAFNLKASDVRDGVWLEFSKQNVFWTLFLGLLAVVLIDELKKKISYVELSNALSVAVAIIAMLAGYALSVDYSYYGVLAVIVAYLFRGDKLLEIAAVCTLLTLFNTFEIWSYFAVIPVLIYNGTRGLKLKYIFYMFYPVHLILLWGVTSMIHS